VLSRQKLPVLDPGQIPDDAIERGAYCYSATPGDPQVILIGTGSEVSLCSAAAELLAEDGIGTRVVSMPCAERFADQPQSYRDEVLPPDVRGRLSVEAGSPLGWRRWIGESGASVALERFGASAPGPVVAEHLGFTAENVAKRARELVS